MNVLLVTADQWRGDCLSCLGHPVVRTPNLDRLAADGVLFTRHYAQATPCGPSRASLHTGLYALNHRSITNGTPLDARHKTLASVTRAAGLDPVLFGYTDTSADPRTLPADSPWLRTYEGMAPGFRAELRLPEAEEAYLDHLAERGYGRRSYEEVYGGGFLAPAPFRAEDSVTAFLADWFLGWLGPAGVTALVRPRHLHPAAPAVRGARAMVLGRGAGGGAGPGPCGHGRCRGSTAPLARGPSGAAGGRRRSARPARRGQPRPLARGLFRAGRRGRPSCRPHPRRADPARRAGPDVGAGDLGPRRDAGRPLDAGQGRLFPAGVPRAAAGTASGRCPWPPRDGVHRACRPDADGADRPRPAGAASMRWTSPVRFPYSPTRAYLARGGVLGA